MKPWLRKLLWIVGAFAVLVVIALLALPALVDVNRYRGLIESKAEQELGREVRLGEMKISVLPFGVRIDDLAIGALPEEGGGDLLSAKRLRLGARLLPLLRKQLEVSSIVVQSPQLRLERGANGEWNVARLLAAEKGSAPSAGEAKPFRVGEVRLTDGRVTLRDAGPGRRQPLELTLTNLDLRLDDVTPDRPLKVALSASLAEAPRARLQLDGTVGPLTTSDSAPMKLNGRLGLRELAPARLRDLLETFAGLPRDLLGDRAFSLEAKIDASLGTPARIALADVTVSDAELNLRRARDGSWNLPSAAGGDGGAGAEIELAGLKVSGATIRVRTESHDAAPLELTLDRLNLSLDRLPTRAEASLDLSSRVEAGGDRGELSLRGRVGPLDERTGDLPAKLQVKLEPIPAALLRSALAGAVDLEMRSSGTALALEVDGVVPRRFDAKGSVALGDAKIGFPGPDGTARSTTMKLGARYDVGVRDSGAALQVRSLVLEPGQNRLELRGSTRQEGALLQLDVELLPARLPADELAAVLALLAPDLPFAFASKTPVELEARARGPYGNGRLPDLEGRAKLRDFTFHHPLMSQPIENVGADVELRGQSVRIASLSGVIGASDVAGNVTLESFDDPQVAFDLRSKRADVGELFSFLRTEPEGATTAPSSTGAAPELSLRGTVAIDSGSFQTLDFSALSTTMQYANGSVTLDPLTMKLYQGSFQGRVTADLTRPEPAFTVLGDVQSLDTDAFLTDNLETPGLLSGRFSGRVETAGSGADYEAIVRALQGTGSMEVKEGRVGRLDVLKTLSRVSGVFGENTLKQLGRRLSREGTPFTVLSSGLKLRGGKLGFEELLLDSPDFRLSGAGDVDLLTTVLEGQFRLSFSQEISEAMRAEKSKAADVFWSSRSGRVELPFTLSGPFDAPKPGVDFKSVARDALRDKASDKVKGLLEDRLGLKPEQPQPTAPPPAPLTPPGEAGGGAAEPPSPAAGGAPGISATINARWGGSLLARDLKLDGQIQGGGITRASLTIVDAEGREVRRVDQLEEVKTYLATSPEAGAAAKLSWKLSIDGKKLLLAKFPVTVKLTVTDAEGGSRETVREVDR